MNGGSSKYYLKMTERWQINNLEVEVAKWKVTQRVA